MYCKDWLISDKDRELAHVDSNESQHELIIKENQRSREKKIELSNEISIEQTSMENIDGGSGSLRNFESMALLKHS